MDYYVYAIKSKRDGRIYVGMSCDIVKRLMYHNQGKVFSTKGYMPWDLVYTEFVGKREKARLREKYWKSGSGKELLKKILRDKMEDISGP